MTGLQIRNNNYENYKFNITTIFPRYKSDQDYNKKICQCKWRRQACCKKRIYNALLNRNTNRKSSTDLREAAWGMYLGLLDKDMRASKYDHFVSSQYVPTVGKPVGKVYKLKNYNPLDDRMLYEALMNPKKNFVVDDYGSSFVMGNYTIGKGQDEKGKYISYYDDWDLSPHSAAGSDESHGIGKPFTLYDRRYYADAEAKAILDLYKGSELEWKPGWQPKPVR